MAADENLEDIIREVEEQYATPEPLKPNEGKTPPGEGMQSIVRQVERVYSTPAGETTAAPPTTPAEPTELIVRAIERQLQPPTPEPTTKKPRRITERFKKFFVDLVGARPAVTETLQTPAISVKVSPEKKAVGKANGRNETKERNGRTTKTTRKPQRELPPHDHLYREEACRVFNLRPDIPERFLLEKLRDALKQLKDHFYKNKRNRSSLAAFCYQLLEKTSLQGPIGDRSPVDFIRFCIQIPLHRGIYLPPMVADDGKRNAAFGVWEQEVARQPGLEHMSFVMQAFQIALSKYVIEVYKPPKTNEPALEPTAIQTEWHPYEPPRIHRHLDWHHGRHPHGHHITDFISDPIPPQITTVLKTILPRGMDSSHLFRTSSFLAELEHHFDTTGHDLSQHSVGGMLNGVYPAQFQLTKRYLKMTKAMNFIRDPHTGRFEPEANCKHHLLLWGQFGHPETYRSQPGVWDSAEEDFSRVSEAPFLDERNANINEHHVLTFIMFLHRSVMEGENIVDVVKHLAPHLDHRHFLYASAEERTPALRRRIHKFADLSEILIRDQLLIQLLRVFADYIEKYPVEQWDQELQGFGLTPFEVLKKIGEKCFPADSKSGQKRYQKYNALVDRQVGKWNFLNEPVSTQTPKDGKRWHQLCRRVAGWRVIHRDITLQFIYAIFRYQGIELGHYRRDITLGQVPEELTRLLTDPETRGALTLLITHRAEGELEVAHYPFWRMET